jgi:hypothetical protein
VPKPQDSVVQSEECRPLRNGAIGRLHCSSPFERSSDVMVRGHAPDNKTEIRSRKRFVGPRKRVQGAPCLATVFHIRRTGAHVIRAEHSALVWQRKGG